ncbi:hypothetical protein [Fretibacterium fastidiosum]|uniref:hypothetical protein n=1 Tax=Fretibacterium fastidiosum TaxID=651822 RepID=UPI001AD814BF|nr:hypothetical protein [Fretibacterium fastidiosum]
MKRFVEAVALERGVNGVPKFVRDQLVEEKRGIEQLTLPGHPVVNSFVGTFRNFNATA